MEFPFGKGEAFMEDELYELTRYYDKVFIIPYFGKGEPRKIESEKIEVANILEEDETIIKYTGLEFIQKQFGLTLSVLGSEMFTKRGLNLSIRKLRMSLIHLKNSTSRMKSLSEFISKTEGAENHFYAMWMSAPASLLAVLKKKGVINSFIARAHGYDIVKERHPNNYIPLLQFNIDQVNHVFANSLFSRKLLLRLTREKKKVSVNYLSLKDRAKAISPVQADNNIFTVASVSNVYDFKRVDKIYEVLNRVANKHEVQWVHFGDGPKMDDLQQLIANKDHMLHINLKGNVPREEIFEYYRESAPDLFIHLSLYEGFGVSLVEAQSFGIPVLVANTGGTSEAVSEISGVLVEHNDTALQIAEIIIKHIENKQWKEKRTAARQFFLDKFEARSAVERFQQLIEQNHVS
ncbi:MAG: glycosyltransferase [Crocinitomicaceae bacterium]|nr:glycosyltransferase [Crocinitomicaceae bacterium]